MWRIPSLVGIAILSSVTIPPTQRVETYVSSKSEPQDARLTVAAFVGSDGSYGFQGSVIRDQTDRGSIRLAEPHSKPFVAWERVNLIVTLPAAPNLQDYGWFVLLCKPTAQVLSTGAPPECPQNFGSTYPPNGMTERIEFVMPNPHELTTGQYELRLYVNWHRDPTLVAVLPIQVGVTSESPSPTMPSAKTAYGAPSTALP